MIGKDTGQFSERYKPSIKQADADLPDNNIPPQQYCLSKRYKWLKDWILSFNAKMRVTPTWNLHSFWTLQFAQCCNHICNDQTKDARRPNGNIKCPIPGPYSRIGITGICHGSWEDDQGQPCKISELLRPRVQIVGLVSQIRFDHVRSGKQNSFELYQPDLPVYWIRRIWLDRNSKVPLRLPKWRWIERWIAMASRAFRSRRHRRSIWCKGVDSMGERILIKWLIWPSLWHSRPSLHWTLNTT